MKSFTYTLRSEFPMLLGTAGHLAAIAEGSPDPTGTVQRGNRCADISRPMRVATMGLRKGDAITVSADGPSELEMLDVLYNYFEDIAS